MPNPEYSENPDRKYLAKGKKGIAPKVLFPKASAPSIKVKYPAIATKSGIPCIKSNQPKKGKY